MKGSVGQTVNQTLMFNTFEKALQREMHLTLFAMKECKHLRAEDPLCPLSTHPPTREAYPCFANEVCTKRKLLLQIVLLSVLRGGFLSSLMVMMAHTFPLYSLFLFLPSLSFFFLLPTLSALKDTCLLMSFQRQRKEDDFPLVFYPIMNILGTLKSGPSEFSRAVLYSGRPAYSRNECRSVL